MVVEIKRKFVLKSRLIEDLLNGECTLKSRDDLSYFYTKINYLEEIKFLKFNENFSIIQKIGKGFMKQEKQAKSSQKEFDKNLKKSLGNLVEKVNFSFEMENLPCNIEIYSGFLQGFITLEVEFLTVEDAKNFIIPELIASQIKAEITDNDRYSDKNLALFGMPNFDFNIIKAIRVIEQNSEMKLEFPGSLRSIDAARAMFLQISKKLQSNKEIYIISGDEKALLQFSLNLNKTRAMIKILPEIFDQKVAVGFSQRLKNTSNLLIANFKILKFLKFLQDQKRLNFTTSAINEKKQKIQTEINSAISSFELSQTIKEWDKILKETSDFYSGENYNQPIKKLVAYNLRADIVRLKKIIFSIDHETENKQFYLANIRIKNAIYLLETFGEMYAIKSLQKAKFRALQIRDLIDELQDRDMWIKMLNSLPQSENDDKLDKIYTKIYKQTYEFRDEILSKRYKFMKNLTKVSRNLKIYYT